MLKTFKVQMLLNANTNFVKSPLKTAQTLHKNYHSHNWEPSGVTPEGMQIKEMAKFHTNFWITHTHTNTQTHTHIHTGQPGWAGSRRNIHHSHLSWSSIIPICFIHLIWSTAFSQFNPLAWQSLSTISLQVFFGLLCHNTKIMSSNPNHSLSLLRITILLCTHMWGRVIKQIRITILLRSCTWDRVIKQIPINSVLTTVQTLPILICCMRSFIESTKFSTFILCSVTAWADDF